MLEALELLDKDLRVEAILFPHLGEDTFLVEAEALLLLAEIELAQHNAAQVAQVHLIPSTDLHCIGQVAEAVGGNQADLE